MGDGGHKGMITVPKISEIKVEGLTVSAAKDSLVKAYSRWIVKPIIDIKVLNKKLLLSVTCGHQVK